MSQLDKQLKQVWDGLRGAHPHVTNFLEEVNIRKMRGIQDLRVPFAYPVTVLAGQNACGKSTVLFACAAAYRSPGTAIKKYVPSSLFPSYSQDGADQLEGIELEYAYIHGEKRIGMKWRRGKAWNKSFLGRKRATQPKRHIYLRTLANLTNPSEVRNMLQIGRRQYSTIQVQPEFLLLAKRVLGFDYQSVNKIEKNVGIGDLLVAELAENKGNYSEFHMASGERSILRLSMELSQLEDALVLIDEVETGLHPYIQKLLMLNLQQLALRKKLQIIVTTHSPVVLECVPPEGRIFLSRNMETRDVRVEQPMRDILQKAMYGQSTDKFSILCEDNCAEAVIRGVVDALSIKLNFSSNQIVVGRNTGKDEFPNHANALAKIGVLSDFTFVLDGDASDVKSKIEAIIKGATNVLLLPGRHSPEEWIWGEIKQRIQDYQELLAISELQTKMQQIETLVSGSIDIGSSERFKIYLTELASETQQEPSEIARKVARQCVQDSVGEITDFAAQLEGEIQRWRTAQA